MFVWDEKKRNKVIAAHATDFEQILDVFEDPFSFDFVDHEHSDEREIRYGLIGRSARYGLVFLVYSIEGEDVRLITSRKAEKWMVTVYEENRRRF